jgi:hypothetical protein
MLAGGRNNIEAERIDTSRFDCFGGYPMTKSYLHLAV